MLQNKTIITGGCSFSTHADVPPMNEYEKTWVNYLSKDCDKIISTGLPACGNSLISKRVIHQLHKHKEEDLMVCIMWSDPIRRDLFVSKEETLEWDGLTKKLGTTEPVRLDENFDNNYTYDNRTWGYLRSGGLPSKDGYTYKEYKKWFENYYEHYYTDEESFILTLESILKVQWYCELNNIPYIFHTWKDIFSEYLNRGYNEAQHLWDMIDFNKWVFYKNFDGLLSYSDDNNFEKWDDGHHIKNIGHKNYYEEILKKRLLNESSI